MQVTQMYEHRLSNKLPAVGFSHYHVLYTCVREPAEELGLQTKLDLQN